MAGDSARTKNKIKEKRKKADESNFETISDTIDFIEPPSPKHVVAPF